MRSNDDLRAAKAAARDVARARRAHAKSVAGADAAEQALAHLLRAVTLPRDWTVAGYWPLEGEFDDVPMLKHFERAGWTCGLPAIAARFRPLVFRRWRSGDALWPGRFGTVEPEAAAPDVEPSLLLVPLLAFDAEGYRLGYGGGYYDRTLERLRSLREILAVGVAFAGQATDSLPRGANDQRLDWVVTEQGATRFRTDPGVGGRA